MTVLVAVKCEDGIIVGADGLSTSAAGPQPLMQIPSAPKIKIIDEKIIIAGTGYVGLSQRFEKIVQSLSTQGIIDCSSSDAMQNIAMHTNNNFQQSGTPRTAQNGWGFGAIVAAPFSQNPSLFELDVCSFQPEEKEFPLHYVSMGSGQIIADPFLAFVNRVIWKDKSPVLEKGLIGIYWVLSQTIKIAPGGVGGDIQIAVLRKDENGEWKAALREHEQIQQLEQHVSEIERQIGELPESVINSAKSSPIPTLDN